MLNMRLLLSFGVNENHTEKHIMWCPKMGCHIKKRKYKKRRTILMIILKGGYKHGKEKSDLYLQHWTKQPVD